MLQLFTDTDTDISPALAAEYGYRLISMPYSVDAQTVYPYEDFDVFEARSFYDMLRSGVIPTTTSISRERYIQYFEPVFAEGNDILYVHFSRAMTRTFLMMDQAVEELKSKYPDRKFYTIDTKGITTISYAIVCEVGEMIKSGKTVEEVLEWAKTGVDQFAMYFFPDDLKFFHRSGLVSGLAALVGDLVGIRPIIHMSAAGHMVPIGKEHGHRKALRRLVQWVEELGADIKSHRFVIGHTDAPEMAHDLGRMIMDRFGDDFPIEYVVCNPTAGSHAGPDGVGVCFHSRHR